MWLPRCPPGADFARDERLRKGTPEGETGRALAAGHPLPVLRQFAGTRRERHGMAIVITVAQQKGGTGKTTLAANLGAALASSRRVALLDIDPQHSLTRWHSLRPANAAKLTFSDVAGWRVTGELDRLKAAHDVVVVDSPPQVDTDARLAIRGATLVLIPVQPSPPDVWAAEGTLTLAAAEKRRAVMVLNRVPAAGKLRETMAAELRTAGKPLLRTTIGNRTGFAGAFADGLGVTEATPRSSAANELRALLTELLEMIE
jgi:chromosome partitioning protein